MVFGEIVEPSTRALIDDEFEEYPEYVKPEFNWEGTIKTPSDINTLVFVESIKMTKLFEAFVLSPETLYCQLKPADLQIHKLNDGEYVVCYTKKDIATGEIIEELSSWLKNASQIYSITSESVSTLQSQSLLEKPETLIRHLSTQNRSEIFKAKKLESPNLVSGLGADVLSYCIHRNLNSTLFVVYMDNSPLDSRNINPIVTLIQSLGLPVRQSSRNLNPIESNLYL